MKWDRGGLLNILLLRYPGLPDKKAEVRLDGLGMPDGAGRRVRD
jgi:hypothetical protein